MAESAPRPSSTARSTSRRAAAAALAALALAACVPLGLAGRGQPGRPGEPVRVGGALPLACPDAGAQLASEVEPSLAADPSDRSRLLGAWQQDRLRGGGARATAVGASRDGGRSWKELALPGLTACTGGPWSIASDPVAVFDAGGSAHVASLVLGDAQRRSGVLVSSSRDLARWSGPVAVDLAPRPALDDKPALAADADVPARLYAAWSRYSDSASESGGARLLFSRSDDGGASWSPASTVYGDGTAEVSSASLLPLAGGRLLLVFTEGSPFFDLDHPGGLVAVRVTRSADGGRSWTPAAVLATYPLGIVHLPGGAAMRAVNQLVAAAGDRSRAYVAWFSAGGAPGQIRLARSDDGGVSWLMLPSLAAGAAAGFLPVLAAGKTSVALLRYRFTSAAGMKQGAEALLATSADGTGWSQARLAPPFDISRAPVATLGAFLGDYQGLAWLGGGSYGALFAAAPPLARSGDSDLFFVRA